MEDAAIVALYLARDEDAVAQTAQKYGARLRQLAFRILENPAAAEECENDTYLEAWNSIPPHEPRTYLFAFLGRITRHLALDLCRRNASQKRSACLCELTREMEECLPGGEEVEDALAAIELREAINRFLRACTQTQRDVFVRRYWFFDSVAEIAKRYGFSQSKVKTTLFRTREALRACLEKEGFTV